jgi:hypothetical protein
MKIGLIFECGPQGADKQVCEYLAAVIRPGIELSCVTLDTKANLLRDAGAVASQMLQDGCACVLIVWDLRPAWPDKKNKPCRAQERAQVLASLTAAGVPGNARIYPVCIEQELESWVLACEQSLAAYLSTKSHAYAVPRVRRPDQQIQPKAVMINHFKAARGWRYDDKIHAIGVLKAASIDLKCLRRSVSFERFESKLLACARFL